jgi:uncharacterized protein YuzE
MKKAKVYKTVKMQDRLIVDVDRKGNVIGIEVLDVSSQVSKKSVRGLEMNLPVFA